MAKGCTVHSFMCARGKSEGKEKNVGKIWPKNMCHHIFIAAEQAINNIFH